MILQIYNGDEVFIHFVAFFYVRKNMILDLIILNGAFIINSNKAILGDESNK
jgi:hypothetical protein